MPANVVGQPVDGRDFFDRRAKLDELWNESQKQALLLLAPRRVGKTSLLLRLRTRVNSEAGARAAYFSCEAVGTEAGFVEALLTAMGAVPGGERALRHLRSKRLRAALEGIKSVSIGGVRVDREAAAEGWRTLSGELAAAFQKLQDHWFILVDELPLLVLKLLRQDPSAGRARDFLQWFRELRQYRSGSAANNLHWILAGSIGLDAVAARHALSDTINDLRVTTLDAFTPEVARDFLRELSEQHPIKLSPELIELMLREAEWLIPYHLQLMFSELRTVCGDRSLTNPTPDHLQEAIELLVTRRLYFDFWAERLTIELGTPGAAHAMAILGPCSADATGAARATLLAALAAHLPDPARREAELRWLLDLLVNDGYLRPEGDRMLFRSHFLRRYWRGRYF